ncbi:hypothetical protein OAG13_06775 [Akkermansiaceae bacterium]|nr:hypothetical protein [Akkermansiaceae bacterium]
MIPALISAGATLYSARKRNKEAQRASSNQMAFQEDMSNTSYQRGMKDMKKAGLNPILAGKMGGASTPGGATYQPQDVGMAGQQAFANVANVMANTAKIKEETKILKRTGGSILGKTGLGIDRLLDDASNSNVGKFVTGKSLTENMKGTVIDKKIREFINDITNAKEATTDKPLRIRIPRRVPKYYINGTRTK